MSQANLAREFVRGADSGTASSVEIRRLGTSDTALVDTRGKGAVYALRQVTRDHPSGHVTAFTGWYGYSPSTSSMLTKMGLSPKAYQQDHREFLADTRVQEKAATSLPCGRGWGRVRDAVSVEDYVVEE